MAETVSTTTATPQNWRQGVIYPTIAGVVAAIIFAIAMRLTLDWPLGVTLGVTIAIVAVMVTGRGTLRKLGIQSRLVSFLLYGALALSLAALVVGNETKEAFDQRKTTSDIEVAETVAPPMGGLQEALHRHRQQRLDGLTAQCAEDFRTLRQRLTGGAPLEEVRRMEEALMARCRQEAEAINRLQVVEPKTTTARRFLQSLGEKVDSVVHDLRATAAPTAPPQRPPPSMPVAQADAPTAPRVPVWIPGVATTCPPATTEGRIVTISPGGRVCYSCQTNVNTWNGVPFWFLPEHGPATLIAESGDYRLDYSGVYCNVAVDREVRYRIRERLG